MNEQSLMQHDTMHTRYLEALHLQVMEGNPLTAQERALFEQFARDGLSPEQQRAKILALYNSAAGIHAAE